MSKGYIYCFSNLSYDGLLKIGFTDRNPKNRANELYKTGVPFPFKIEFVKYVDEPKIIETSIHNFFNKYRVNPK